MVYVQSLAEFAGQFEALSMGLISDILRDLPLVAAGGAVTAALHRFPLKAVPARALRAFASRPERMAAAAAARAALGAARRLRRPHDRAAGAGSSNRLRAMGPPLPPADAHVGAPAGTLFGAAEHARSAAAAAPVSQIAAQFAICASEEYVSGSDESGTDAEPDEEKAQQATMRDEIEMLKASLASLTLARATKRKPPRRPKPDAKASSAQPGNGASVANGFSDENDRKRSGSPQLDSDSDSAKLPASQILGKASEAVAIAASDTDSQSGSGEQSEERSYRGSDSESADRNDNKRDKIDGRPRPSDSSLEAKASETELGASQSLHLYLTAASAATTRSAAGPMPTEVNRTRAAAAAPVGTTRDDKTGERKGELISGVSDEGRKLALLAAMSRLDWRQDGKLRRLKAPAGDAADDQYQMGPRDRRGFHHGHRRHIRRIMRRHGPWHAGSYIFVKIDRASWLAGTLESSDGSADVAPPVVVAASPPRMWWEHDPAALSSAGASTPPITIPVLPTLVRPLEPLLVRNLPAAAAAAAAHQVRDGPQERVASSQGKLSRSRPTDGKSKAMNKKCAADGGGGGTSDGKPRAIINAAPADEKSGAIINAAQGVKSGAGEGKSVGLEVKSVWGQLGGSDGDVRRRRMLRSFLTTDIDLFLVTRDATEAVRTMLTVDRRIRAALPPALSRGIRVMRTDHATTWLLPFPYRTIQIVHRLYYSMEHVLLGFDIDSCCVGFDGRRVVALPRAMRALQYRYNLVDVSRQSTTYESRLLKYAKRGFAIAVPSMDLVAEVKILGPMLEQIRDGRQPVLAFSGLQRLLGALYAIHASDDVLKKLLCRTDRDYGTDTEPSQIVTQIRRAQREDARVSFAYGKDLRSVLTTSKCDAGDRAGSHCQSTVQPVISFQLRRPHLQDRVDLLYTGSFHPTSLDWYGAKVAAASALIRTSSP
jgi:hypothetical protein